MNTQKFWGQLWLIERKYRRYLVRFCLTLRKVTPLLRVFKSELEVDSIPMVRAWIESGFNEYDVTEAECPPTLLKGDENEA